MEAFKGSKVAPISFRNNFFFHLVLKFKLSLLVAPPFFTPNPFLVTFFLFNILVGRSWRLLCYMSH